MRTAALVLLAGFLVAGCATPAPRPAAEPEAAPAAAPTLLSSPSSEVGARAAAIATRLIGTPYHYGGATPSGFDCSGLVYYIYQKLGITLPRTAAAQRQALPRVSAEALRPGDLVFFYTPEDHVGIYVGDGEFVHAPASGRLVERTRLDSPFFILGYAGGARVTTP